jgi:putative transposase
MDRQVRRQMIEPDHPALLIGARCSLLSISRSSFYYEPRGETEMNLALMQLIDRKFLETPFYGVRQMTWHLQNEGHAVNPKRIRRLMRLMRLTPIYQKLNTSKPAKGNKTYPYLLGGLRVERPNQAWCADITYLPRRRGFLYLVAIMDWFTRKVLAWRISNTLEADFCIEALNEAVHRFGPPEIMNTDSQSVHRLRLDRPAETGRHPDLDGRQGALPRQHLHRAPVAILEVRLSARLGDRHADQGWRRSVDRLLQLDDGTPTGSVLSASFFILSIPGPAAGPCP